LSSSSVYLQRLFSLLSLCLSPSVSFISLCPYKSARVPFGAFLTGVGGESRAPVAVGNFLPTAPEGHLPECPCASSVPSSGLLARAGTGCGRYVDEDLSPFSLPTSDALKYLRSFKKDIVWLYIQYLSLESSSSRRVIFLYSSLARDSPICRRHNGWPCTRWEREQLVIFDVTVTHPSALQSSLRAHGCDTKFIITSPPQHAKWHRTEKVKQTTTRLPLPTGLLRSGYHQPAECHIMDMPHTHMLGAYDPRNLFRRPPSFRAHFGAAAFTV